MRNDIDVHEVQGRHILAGPIMDQVQDHVFKCSSRIASTFGGNLVDMVRCRRILEIIESDKLVDAAARQGDYLMSQLNALQGTYADRIDNVRGQGLLCAFDLQDSQFRDRFAALCIKDGLLVVGCGSRSISLRHHLIVVKAEIDHGISIMRRVMEKIE